MRHPDWPELLAEFIEVRRDRAFAWGSHDCVLMAADWIEQATGVDPIADLRGRWTDALQAARTIAEVGGLNAAVTARLGRAHDCVLMARRGDVALIVHAGRQTLAVVTDAGLACPGEAEMAVVPLSAAEVAWPV